MQKRSKTIARPVEADIERLSKEKRENPAQVLHEFCDSYHLHEVRKTLWDWLVTALGKTHSIYDDAKERSNLFFFYENVEELMEAVYLLHQQQETPKPAARPKKNTGEKQ
jgi:hypothetical protein